MTAPHEDQQVERLAGWLNQARFVCAITGAGISAESGLSTFRGVDGLWKGRNPAMVATPEAFNSDPREVWQFYNWRLRAAISVQPNAGHIAMVELASLLNGFGLITQNVDRLHQRAGSRDVVELHGNIHEVRCTNCNYSNDIGDALLPDEPKCPECGAWLRPCVVWFGEMLPPQAVLRAGDWAGQCDVFMSIGTSAVVYPASQFALQAHTRGARVVEINPEQTPLSAQAHLSVRARSGEFLPRVVSRLRMLKQT